MKTLAALRHDIIHAITRLDLSNQSLWVKIDNKTNSKPILTTISDLIPPSVHTLNLANTGLDYIREPELIRFFSRLSPRIAHINLTGVTIFSLDLYRALKKTNADRKYVLNSVLLDPLLIEAAKSGDTASVETLVKEVEDINHINEAGFTALMHAADNGHTNIVNLLIAAGAYTGCNNVLLAASYKGHLDIVKALLTLPTARVNFKDSNGNTALTLANSKGHRDIVELLEAAQKQQEPTMPAYKRQKITRENPARFFTQATEIENSANRVTFAKH